MWQTNMFMQQYSAKLKLWTTFLFVNVEQKYDMDETKCVAWYALVLTLQLGKGNILATRIQLK